MGLVFISILTLMDAEALAGFAMTDKTSAFSSKNNKNVLNADAFWKPIPNIQQRKMSLGVTHVLAPVCLSNNP